MARIDASFGRQAGVNPASVTPERSTALEQLGRGVEAVGAALEDRREFSRQVDFIREARADDLALADLSTRKTLEWNKRLDEEADLYDGAAGGFGDRISADFQKRLDEDVAKEPPRRQREARLALMGVVQRLSLAAYDIEDGRRDAFILSEAARQSDADANAVRQDPAFYETALENHERRKRALPGDLQKDFDRSRQGLALAYGEARIDADPDGFLKELKGGGLKEIDGELYNRLVNSATSESKQRKRQALADAKSAAAEAKAIVSSEMKAIADAVDAGLPVDQNRLSAVAGAAAMGGPKVQAKFEEAAAIVRGAAYIQRAPFADSEADLAAERARIVKEGDAQGFASSRLVALEKTLAATQRRAREDFAGFAAGARPDLVKPLDPDAIDGAAIKERAIAIDAAADYYGIGKEKTYFSDTERAAIARRFIDDPPGALEAAAVMAAAGEAGGSMLAEIAPKAPELAHLGGLLAANGDQQFIDDAAAGAALARRPGFKTAIAATGQEQARALLGPAFALFPQSAAAAASSARFAYEARASRYGLSTDEFDPAAFERAVQEAAGGVYDHRGKLRGGVQSYTANRYSGQALLPSWMANGDLKRHMRALIDEDIGEAVTDGDGNPLRLQVLRNAFPVAVGDGKYQLALGDPVRDPEWVKGADGGEYVLDLARVRDRLAPKPASKAAVKAGLQGEQ